MKRTVLQVYLSEPATPPGDSGSDAEAVAKNQLAEDALNQLKETSSVETARLTAANEAAKTEAAELNEAIGNINDQLDDANTKKKELKGEIMQTMSDTDDIKADTVMVKGAKKKKKMAAFLDDDEDDAIPSTADDAIPSTATGMAAALDNEDSEQ